MISPNVELIEAAADALARRPEWLIASQRKELASFGGERAKQLGASGFSTDFERGYLLGLETIRQALKQNAAIITAGITEGELP